MLMTIIRLESLVNGHGVFGEPGPYKDLLLFAIAGLNHRYNVFVCIITDQVTSITIEEFHNKLLVFEHLLKQQEKDE